MNNSSDPLASDSGDSDSETPGPKRSLAIAFYLTVLGLVAGIVCLFPYLEREHRRIEPPKSLEVWAVEIPSLLWFGWFFIKHYVHGRPLRFPVIAASKLPREWWVALFTILGAVGIGFWIMLSLMREETAAFQKAAMAVGQITTVKKKTYAEAFLYSFQCRFQDGQGFVHHARFEVNEFKGGGFPEALPKEVRQSLQQGKVPCPIKIAYDPDWPERNWIAGIEDGGQRLHRFLGWLLLFQGFGTFLFALGLASYIRLKRKLPWWYELHMVLPLMVEAVFVGFLGIVTTGLSTVVDWAFNN